MLFLVILMVTLQITNTYGLECFSCHNVSKASDCVTTVNCTDQQWCSSTYTNTGGQATYNFTCRPIQECLFGGGGGLVGRRQTMEDDTCSQCCSKPNCNGALCVFDAVDGGFSEWGEWLLCSSVCGFGTTSRTRTCTNPSPAHGGSTCVGNSTENAVCVPIWSTWSLWSTCTASCKGGLQLRNRTCLSMSGNGCYGNNEDARLCYPTGCTDDKVAFSVISPTGALKNGVPIFSKAFSNSGSYNMNTGKFTCPVPGLYTFTVTLQHDAGNLQNPTCHLTLNGELQTKIQVPENRPYHMVAESEVLYLNTNDIVDLKCNSTSWAHVSHGPSTSFSGIIQS